MSLQGGVTIEALRLIPKDPEVEQNVCVVQGRTRRSPKMRVWINYGRGRERPGFDGYFEARGGHER
jgi:hypothetical protein